MSEEYLLLLVILFSVIVGPLAGSYLYKRDFGKIDKFIEEL